MNFLLSSAAVGLALAVGSAYADTRNTKDKATMERKASPAAPKSDEERAEASQGQPNTPHPQGSPAPSSKKKSGKDAKSSSGASTGSSAPTALSMEKEQLFKGLDVDGDGGISKAEAAGHEKVVTGFDRADADRDGKLSRAEYDRLGQPAVKGKRKARAKTALSQ
jgi:hypothetical protein